MKTLHYVSINPRFRLHMEYPKRYQKFYENSRNFQAELIKKYRKKNPQLIEVLVFATEEDL